MLNLSTPRLKSGCAALAVCVLAAVVAPIAASAPVGAQSQTGWYVNDDPALFGPSQWWYRGEAGHGYGANNYRFTYAIGGSGTSDNWAHWYMGNRVGRQEIQVYVPTEDATATVNYNIYIGSNTYRRAAAQRNISGWHSLGNWDTNGADVVIAVFDNDVKEHHERDGLWSSRIGVDAIRMRCVSNCGSPPPPPPPPASTAPGPPRDVSLTLTDADSFRIDWDPPSDDGGSPITGYGVAVQHVSSGDIAGWSTTGTSTSFDGVVGAIYAVEIWAENSRGSGSAQRAQITIPSTGDVPGPPRNLSLKSTGSGEVRIKWDAPASDGGSRIIRYSLNAWSPDGSTFSWSTTNTEYRFKGEVGAFYTVSVTAENRHGPSTPVRESIYIDTDTPLPTVTQDDAVPPTLDDDDGAVPPTMDEPGEQSQASRPTAPRNLRLTLIDDDSFRVTWDPPSNNGGAPVTGYTLEISRPRLSSTVDPWSKTYTRRGRSFTLNGRKGATYTVRVSANNRVGTGRSVSRTIVTPPERETPRQDDSSPAPLRNKAPGRIHITEIRHDERTFESDPVTVTWTSDENATHYELAWWVARNRSEDPLNGRDVAYLAEIERATELVCCERNGDVHTAKVRPNGIALMLGDHARPPTSYTIQGRMDGIDDDKWILGKLLFTVRAVNERISVGSEGPWSDGEPPKDVNGPIIQRPASGGRGLPAAKCKFDNYNVKPSDIITVATLSRIIRMPGSTVIGIGLNAIWDTIRNCGSFWDNLWDGIKETLYLDKLIEALDSVRCWVNTADVSLERLAEQTAGTYVSSGPYIQCGKLYE